MLKIGTLRWKGRCGRHPMYDPAEGEGAIRGGCTRCQALLEIHRQHLRLVEMMRAFGPAREKPVKPARLLDEFQPSLFD
ncbi:MAG: hypothetical protein JSU00_23395 [Acidobacteria bacterium]|nr:hypothetical protein [Acidobacteriota bacterium]